MLPQNQNKVKEALNSTLENISAAKVIWKHDATGNNACWIYLDGPGTLIDVAKVLAGHKARLCTITAYATERNDQDRKRAIAYHFALGGVLVNVTVPIYDPETAQKLSVPSITPYFRNADWNEREFREMYNIEVTNHPNPNRLFLDERLDAGIMTSLIPFSTMMHGAGSKTLWEKVMAEKTGCDPAAFEGQQEMTEPEFTPVATTSADDSEGR